MDEQLLDPARIGTLTRIMHKYGEHLRADDRVRLGVEGDPCYAYRSVDEAPTGRVVDVSRRDDGFVSFQVELDGTGETRRLTTRSFDPAEVWEIEPASIPLFRGRLAAESGGSEGRNDSGGEGGKERSGGGDDALRSEVAELSERLTRFTQDVSERLAAVEDQRYRGNAEDDEAVGALRRASEEFREVMTSTVRALAGDTLRLAKGEPIEFAHEFVDRYDATTLRAADRYDAAADGTAADDQYRGSPTTRPRVLKGLTESPAPAEP